MTTRVGQMVRYELRAMNTDCLLILHPRLGSDPTVDLERAAEQVQLYEARFSRFLADSDLSHLNDDPRERVEVTPELAAILARGLQYARLTNGVFDPVVLADMRAIGYDRSFEKIGDETHVEDARPAHRCRWMDVSVDARSRVVRRPMGALIDLGGLAKGAAADAAMAKLAGHPGALVDLGGDVRTSGGPGDADFWLVGMDDGQDETREIIGLRDGAIATSSARKRRWLNNGRSVHHVIDPRNGQPADSGALQCSAIADTAEHAEVAAKVGLVLGPWTLDEDDDLGRALRVRGAAWITNDNAYLATDGWKAHVHV